MRDRTYSHPAGDPKRSRREFFRQTTCRMVSVAGLASCLGDLRKIAAATLSNSSLDDYKALVCLFLYGGNDSSNVIVPSSAADYRNYAQARTNLALAKSSLLPISPLQGDGRSYGLHPSMPETQDLFGRGKLAILFNAGTLVAPITRSDWDAGTAALPPSLGSHVDQANFWQTSLPDRPLSTGWGGRLADLMQSMGASANQSISMSLAGDNTFQAGNSVFEYQISSDGVIQFYDHADPASPQTQAIDRVLASTSGGLYERAVGAITRRAIDNNQFIASVVNSAPSLTLTHPFPDTDLGNQLAMVARLISGRDALQMKRQIFFCSVNGYDTHADELDSHTDLLRELSQCLAAFYESTDLLGVANNVTLFTASDFGRAFSANGSGTDHGWGSHHFILGGSVRGASLYGKFPEPVAGGPDDIGSGWLPTTSVDEYAATLAKWFGVSATDMPAIIPNIGRYAHADLGFLA